MTEKPVSFQRFALRHVGGSWRELVLIAGVAAMAVTPADPMSMAIAIPPLFVAAAAA